MATPHHYTGFRTSLRPVGRPVLQQKGEESWKGLYLAFLVPVNEWLESQEQILHDTEARTDMGDKFTDS